MVKKHQHIQLISPVMDQIPTYVMDNSICLKCGNLPLRVTHGDFTKAQEDLDKLTGRKHPGLEGLFKVCQCPEPERPPLIKENQYKGKTVMICGSGPSLKKSARRIKRGEVDHVWACNDALMWLTRNKYKVTHGVGIDQSPALRTECWIPEPPDVPYLLATSVEHELVKYLRSHGRQITFFHSFIGFPGEYDLYSLLYNETKIAGEGLNVVNRAINIADYAGYKTIYVAGADCAFGPGKTFHVHGDKITKGEIFVTGEIDGKIWHSKPDMLMSATCLVRTKRELGSKLQLLGNTLPVALQHKDDEFLDRCIKFATPDEKQRHNASMEIQKYAPRLDKSDIETLLEFKGTLAEPHVKTSVFNLSTLDKQA